MDYFFFLSYFSVLENWRWVDCIHLSFEAVSHPARVLAGDRLFAFRIQSYDTTDWKKVRFVSSGD